MLANETTETEVVAETTDTGTLDGSAAETPARINEPTRESLESKMEQTLANARKSGVFGDDDDATLEAAAPADDATAAKDDETPAATDETADEQVDDAVEEDGTQTTEKTGAAAVNAPTLPDAYRRSLKAYDWTDAEIDANFKAYGPKFLDTAAKMHQSRNAELQKWAELGRQQRTQQSITQEPAKLEALKPADMDALKSKYGNDGMVDELFGPLNAMMKQINAVLPIVQQSQERARQSELETLQTQVDGFFGSKELEPYAETYGKSVGQLDQKQIDARNGVLELADAMMGGAAKQGHKLSLKQALQLSLDSLTGPQKEQVARQKIVKQMKTRERSITLAPTARRTTNTPKAGDRTALEQKVRSGLAAAFT